MEQEYTGREELIPCPFCGGKKIKFDKCTKRVRCANCFATSGMISKFIAQGMNEDEAALAAWNTRYDNAKNE